MKRKMMKFLSLFLSVSMAINVFTVPVFAAPEDEGAAAEQSEIIEDDAVENVENGTEQENVSDGTEADADAVPAEETPAEVTAAEEIPAEEATTEEAPKRETISVEESYKAFTVNVNDIDFEVDADAVILLGAGEETAEVDTSNPVISVVEEELNDIRVLNDEGEKVPLTEEQIQTVVYLYQQYLQQWADNANLLGVQMPFFLQYNDDEEDGLGILGEMLVLAGYTVDDVRNGGYKYDDLVGMIQNFYYADQLGVEIYGEDIAAARDEALAKVKDSGATTLVQKMLVINDWLAHKATFDMSYIMNMGKETPIMVAENPQQHKSYQKVYDTMYAVYKQQITQQFHDQIYDGVVAQLRQQYYEGAIKNIVMEGYKSQVRQQVYNNALTEMGTDSDNATDEQKDQAEAAADAYMEENAETIDADASAYAEKYMTDNADAISEDPDAFIKTNFGEDVAAQVSAGADDFIKDAEENGVEVDPENAPGYKMTVEDLTQQTMANEKIVDLDGDGTNDTTANDAIPIFADQAAQGLTSGILGAWEGNHIGILSGYNTGVCCGYAKAFAYLVQYMMPEIYGINGEGTDMSVSSNWKTAEALYYDEDGNLDITKDYAVDLVRITFQTSVTMYGEENPDFNSDHFWNAVKVDGEWYYIDPCYIDVYTEVMSRDRVEMDGNLNHMYFMFSHSTAAEMYDGYMGGDGIKSLYADAATDTSYEDSWYARISSNAYSDENYFYYLYDSSDMFGLMREMNQDSSSDTDYEKFMEMTNAEYKLVRHAISSNDVVEGGADSGYDTLIEFNHKVNEDDDDDDTTVARVNINGKMVENELLTELFAQFKEECDIYPSISISTALYNGKLYFNLSNCILSYDLSSGEVVKVKEYNTVYGARDNTKAFGGMAFSVVDSASEATHTVENHPIASMTIKDDGKMYVSIATNFAYISGKDPHDCADSKDNGYGYEFEESNYNPNYSTYFDMDEISAEYGEIDSDSQDNDNDEFMWSAVFVDTLSMSHLAGGSHSYSEVTVEPFCGRDGFTENRCTECGAIEADSRVVDEGSACDHHYIHFDETYYTKDDNDDWNTGECYVCTICGSAVSEPVEPEKNAQESDEEFAERQEQYEKDKAEYEAIKANAGHVFTSSSADSVTWNSDEESGEIISATVAAGEKVCEPCDGKPLDVLQKETTKVTLDEAVTLTEIDKKAVGKCEDGLTVTYIATGSTEDGKKLSATKTEATEPGEHAYVVEFTWTAKEAESETPEEGSESEAAELAEEESEDSGETEEPETEDEIPYTVTAVFTCASCGDKIEDGVEVEVTVDEENSKAATCAEAGTTVYAATATAKDENGDTIATGTGTKEDEIAVLPHEYAGEFTWTEVTDSEGKGTGEYTATVTVTCVNGGEVIGENVEAAVEEDTENEKNKAATCTEDGVKVLKATATVTVGEGEEAQEVTVKDEKEVVIPALGHEYGEPTWEWAKDNSTASAKFTCTRDEHVERVDAKVTSETTDPTCEEAGKTVYTATCEFEGTTYTDTQEVEIKALGHEYGDPEWSWAEDYSEATATFTCANGHTTEVTAKVTSESKDADCETAGTVTYTATAEVEGKTYTDVKTVEGQALGHDYKAEFTWTEVKDADVPYTATVILTCTRCEDKVTDIPVTVVLNKEASKAATCEEAGKNVYTATATYEGKDYTEDKTDTIKALGHEYGEPEWSWAEDYSKATATFTCTRDSQHVETVEAVITKKIDREAQKTIYTATATLDGKDYTDVQEVEGISDADINPFVDVSEDDYYYDAVLWAYNNNITTGYDETHFAPLEDCTRAQVVTFLWRTVGEPEPKAVKQPFVDVAEGDYYYKAVLWAYENGITTGKDETHFAPNEKVSREQFVTFLYRQKGEPAYTTKNPFVDVEEGTFYYDAILWAYENGITTGTDETHFSPEAICIRGDVVTFLYRAYGEEE